MTDEAKCRLTVIWSVLKVTLSMSLYNVGDTLLANFPSFTEVDDDDDDD